MNPFDQFGGELQSALPQQQQNDGQSIAGGTVASQQQQLVPQQFNLMTQPSQEKKTCNEFSWYDASFCF